MPDRLKALSMRFLFTISFAIGSLVVAAITSAVIGSFIAGYFGMSDFEGGRGMFASFVIGPIGASAGLVVGCIIGWREGNPPLRRRQLLLLAGIIMLGLVLSIVVWSYG